MRPDSGSHSFAVLYSFSGFFQGTPGEYETKQGVRTPKLSLRRAGRAVAPWAAATVGARVPRDRQCRGRPKGEKGTKDAKGGSEKERVDRRKHREDRTCLFQ